MWALWSTEELEVNEPNQLHTLAVYISLGKTLRHLDPATWLAMSLVNMLSQVCARCGGRSVVAKQAPLLCEVVVI